MPQPIHSPDARRSPRALRLFRSRGSLLPSLAVLAALVLLPATSASQQVAAVAPPAGATGVEDTAEEDADRHMEAVRAPLPRPEVDGDLTDEAWAAAPVATDFVQYDPAPGTEPSQRTEVRLLYTSDAVYVGARMYDTHPDSILARLSRRDEHAVADEFMVGFDSYHDRRTAFVFAVTAAGVQSDELLYDDTNSDGNWDAVWESAVDVDSAGWVAEMRIPLSQLRFSAPEDSARGDTWGVNFQREIARLDETVQWSPFPADGSRMVSAFGTLTGLKRLSPPNNLEVRPYTVLKANRAPVDRANPFRGPTEMAGSLGGSLSYGITPNVTLNATVNPDFGQVEADPSVVNLSAFETFFPEKRPFFQEGVDIFQVPIGFGGGNNEQLFYSRRIGRTPRGSAPSDATYSKNPDATTILGAAKLSGKTSSGWSVGVLNALTAEEEARFMDPGQGVSTVTTEPMTNYGVARVKRDFRDGESSVGAVFTSTIREVDPAGPVSDLPGGAYSGGLDAMHRFDGDWRLTAKVLGSHVTGNAGAIDRLQRGPNHYYQRPDADHVTYDPGRTSLSGASAGVELMKLGGHFRGAVFGETRTPGFDVNELGFQRGADMSTGALWMGYRSLGPTGPFRRVGVNLNGYSGWTWGGERVGGGGNVNGNVQLRNYWSAYAGVNVNARQLSTTELRGGPAIRQEPRLNGWAGLHTDSRKTVRFGLNTNWSVETTSASRRISVGPGVTIQPTDAAQLSLRPRMTWNRDVSQYVTTADGADGGTHYLFGRLEQRTASLTTRLDYTFSPDLSLQLYAQPFISAGDYSGFGEVRDPKASSFDARFRTYTDAEIASEGGSYSVDRDGDGGAEIGFDDPDFNIRQLRSNVVLRWEYMPGSRIFAVWSQDRSGFAPDGTFDLGRDVDALFGAEGRNVFLVKVEHWLGL